MPLLTNRQVQILDEVVDYVPAFRKEEAPRIQLGTILQELQTGVVGDIYVNTTGDTMTGPLVINTPTQTPLDMTGPTTLAGAETAMVLRNAAGTPVITFTKIPGTENVEIRFLGEPVASPNLAIGSVFTGFPSYFGYKNDISDLSLGIVGDPTFYLNFGTVFPPAAPPDRFQIGSAGANGHPNVVTVVHDPTLTQSFGFGPERGLHLVHNIDTTARWFNLSVPASVGGQAIMRFGANVAGLDIQEDLEVDGFGVGVTPVGPQADPVALTDSSGGTADNTVAAVAGTGDDATINDNFADLTAKYNALRDLVRAFGLAL